MRFRFGPALHVLTALALAAGAAPTRAGQQGTPGARSPRPDSMQREIQRTVERELLLKEMQAAMAKGPATQPQPRMALTQIKEDFTRIQVVNNALAKALATGQELDFKLVAESASEIKKRAGRLKDNLILPESVEARQKRAPFRFEPSQLKAALAELDRLVISFVHNPGFRSVKVVDAEWSARARSDLEGIIELSGRVKTFGEQLHKASQKPR